MFVCCPLFVIDNELPENKSVKPGKNRAHYVCVHSAPCAEARRTRWERGSFLYAINSMVNYSITMDN